MAFGLGDISGGSGGIDGSSSSSAQSGSPINIGGFNVPAYSKGIKTEYVLGGVIVLALGAGAILAGKKKRKG